MCPLYLFRISLVKEQAKIVFGMMAMAKEKWSIKRAQMVSSFSAHLNQKAHVSINIVGMHVHSLGEPYSHIAIKQFLGQYLEIYRKYNQINHKHCYPISLSFNT